MADTSFAVTAGSGTNLHTVTTSIGGTTVHDQTVKQGPPYLATYTVTTASTSIATANAHPLQIMAGASLNVFLSRLRVYQSVLVTTAALATWEIWRLSTAGTGGTSITPAPLDTGDSASGATAMTLPTAKGTEATKLWSGTVSLEQTAPTAGANTLLIDIDFDDLPRTKLPELAAGATNGFALKWVTASTGASIIAVAEIVEANFSQ